MASIKEWIAQFISPRSGVPFADAAVDRGVKALAEGCDAENRRTEERNERKERVMRGDAGKDPAGTLERRPYPEPPASPTPVQLYPGEGYANGGPSRSVPEAATPAAPSRTQQLLYGHVESNRHMPLRGRGGDR